jgi:hypothetical protein
VGLGGGCNRFRLVVGKECRPGFSSGAVWANFNEIESHHREIRQISCDLIANVRYCFESTCEDEEIGGPLVTKQFCSPDQAQTFNSGCRASRQPGKLSILGACILKQADWIAYFLFSSFGVRLYFQLRVGSADSFKEGYSV